MTRPVPRTLAVLLVALLLAAWPRVGGLADDDEEAERLGRYGGTPEAFVPYRDHGEPARRFFEEAPAYRGPREGPPAGLEAVRIGLLAPLGGVDEDVGRQMLQGVQLALEEANARGGVGGLPVELALRDENDVWGAAGNALVELATEERVVAVLGALEDANSHVMTRVLLKVEVPMVNTGGPDPTLTEHNIPWLVRMRPDDRQTSYRLAERIFLEDGHRRVSVFRANDRYGRTGTRELVDAARRIHHPILLEVRFDAAARDLGAQVERLRASRPDAIVVWGRAEAAGRALRALRVAGLDQPVYGPDRLVDPAFLAAAGEAAEGVVATHPFDPTTEDGPWAAFRDRYHARFGEAPGLHAGYGHDGATYLLEAIERAGPARAAVRDALYAPRRWEGVTGEVVFDATQNNVARMRLGRVVDGAWVFDDGP